jgi:hypothetical protein
LERHPTNEHGQLPKVYLAELVAVEVFVVAVYARRHQGGIVAGTVAVQDVLQAVPLSVPQRPRLDRTPAQWP